jgi:hypothetical protein
MESKESKAAKKFIDENRITDNSGSAMKTYHITLKDAFIAGIQWERRRLKPKLSKMFSEVAVSLHIEEEG